MRRNRWPALLLALVMTLSLMPAAEAQESAAPAAVETQSVENVQSTTAVQGSSWPSASASNTYTDSSKFPLTLKSETYKLSNLSYTANPGQSPITVPRGVSATLIIDGNVTLSGANANGMQGATAGIRVEEGATLTIYSAHDKELSTSTDAPKDTLTVIGGNAANGADGGDALLKHEISGSAHIYTWFNGAGGNGGGGAAAAIGGNGGLGGNGATEKQTTGKNGKPIKVTITTVGSDWDEDATNDNPGKSGLPGAIGTNGETPGTIYILGRLTLNATGGSGGNGGNGGAGCEGMRSTSNADHMIGGNGGGGGGGGGCAAPAIGAGGAGGSGGGAGGHLSSDKTGDITGCGGGGGGGGWPNGGGGGGGATVTSGNKDEINAYNNKGGSGGSGGKAGYLGNSGQSGGTIRPAKGTASKGGNGGGGVSSDSASGGQGGTRVSKPSEYPGGNGGAGGGYLSKAEWHTSGNLVLSTANNLNLSGFSSYGDGQGHGSTGTLTPSVVYDLMDCAVNLTETPTYTGAQIKPSFTVTYSDGSDRDGKRVSSSGTTTVPSSNYTTAYGENIHCPTGTIELTGTADRSTHTNGAVVGTRTQEFTINKAKITSVDITMDPVTSDESPLPFNDYLGASDPARIILGNYTSTAKYDTGKDIGEITLATPSGYPDQWQGFFIVSWIESNGYKITTEYGYPRYYTFESTRGGKFSPQIKLSNMNDFEDFTTTIPTITVDKSHITADLSPNPPHPRMPVTVTIPDDAGNVTYQWYIGDQKITGATSSTYTPKNSDIGKNLNVHIIPTDANSPYKIVDDAATGNYVKDHSYNNYNNGFCTVCGEYEKPSLSNDGYYEIDNGGKMFWFAAHINGDTTHAEDATSDTNKINARLTADISLRNPKDSGSTEWTPIGETSGKGDNAFTGIFDGQGHTISDLSITTVDVRTGLFGTTKGATVKNFTIEGRIALSIGNDGSSSGIGGAIGTALSGTTVRDVTSHVNISNTSAYPLVHVGGVVGELNASKAEKCMFFGSIDLQNAEDCVGGVIGYINNSDVGYCANLGTVKTATKNAFVGGVLGYLNNTNGKVHNCYNYGAVQNGGGSYCGAIIGYLKSGTAANITDNYYLAGSASSAFGSGSITTTATAPAMNKDAFASGEVCYLVNSKTSTGDKALWKQNIDNGKTPYDLYPVFNADPVYYRSDHTYSNYPEDISVTVSWGSMEFVCTQKWDPDTHKTTVTWSPSAEGSNKFTVTNNSNVTVKVTASFTPEDTLEGCGLSGAVSDFADTSLGWEAGKRGTLTLSSDSVPSSLTASPEKIGTLTITVKALYQG